MQRKKASRKYAIDYLLARMQDGLKYADASEEFHERFEIISNAELVQEVSIDSITEDPICPFYGKGYDPGDNACKLCDVTADCAEGTISQKRPNLDFSGAIEDITCLHFGFTYDFDADDCRLCAVANYCKAGAVDTTLQRKASDGSSAVHEEKPKSRFDVIDLE